MTRQRDAQRFRTVGDGSGLAASDSFYPEEIQLALRNRGMPLEALRYSLTPTGMHFLLIHFDIPEVDAGKWQLKIGGLVANPVNLTLEDIKQRPSQTLAVTMECAGNGRALMNPRPLSQPWLLEAVGTAEWTGTPLRGILEEAGIAPNAVEILFTGLDQGVQGNEVQYYQRSLSIDEATRDEMLLAYEMNGEALQPQHGYPLRLIVPGWYGMTSVKWLDRIEAIAKPFDGYQMSGTYRFSQTKNDPGEPVTLIRVRALMSPPGIPDFMTRTRLVEPGPVSITGRAWAGRQQVAGVEVSTDGGSTWDQASLDERGNGPVSPFAWRQWSFQWDARPGRYILLVRATDSQGNVQPVSQPWNFQGMGNNIAQRVEVLVE
ncbi:MAG: sulfite oxidase [Chloroflexi bacterium]|nr:sulfite oxidase [Chloroflexota bacterium]MCI0792965.1 sulfite oxidase [Chloroflexota bacterium]MCI0878127.1 sulfite oxidase [Chloroflexota bacterium]